MMALSPKEKKRVKKELMKIQAEMAARRKGFATLIQQQEEYMELLKVAQAENSRAHAAEVQKIKLLKEEAKRRGYAVPVVSEFLSVLHDFNI